MRIRLMTAAALASVALLTTAGAAVADSDPVGVAVDSPGVLSGNVIQIPVHVPINVCGNSINIVGLLNPAAGNECRND
ncbi:chaplin [Streptomyces sp. NPDC050704]|uniref:chaplin n=1 Tax=Streptomyces sp. NPDC050704 TaxID=3157219 RepID=UPI00341A12FF